MPKRKRSGSDKASGPDLLNYPESTTKNDELLLQVLQFSNHKTDTDENSLKFLIEALEEKDDTKPSVVSLNDLALLVLPWTLKSILGASKEHHLVWRGMAASLGVLTEAPKSVQYMLHQQVLNQSTLFKLCPKAALASSSSRFAVACYNILLDRFFRPTLDVACKSLLLKLTKDSPSEVVHSTLELIRTLQLSRKGNPKTTFQLLANRPVFLALSESAEKGILNKIFSDAFFENHLDGYYSVLHKAPLLDFRNEEKNKASGKKNRFHCYQEELLALVDSLLSADADEKEQAVGIRVAPLLFECFVQQKWDSFKKKNNFNLSLIQFQFFARLTVRLQELLLSSSSQTTSILESLNDLLGLVLEHNVYTPSQDGSDGKHFDFLQALALQVLPIPESIPILSTMIRLNHLILYEEATRTLSLSLSGSVGGIEYWCTFWTVYRQLRQQGFATTALLAVIDDQHSEKVRAMLREPSVVSAMVDSIQSSPIGQTREMFDTFERWLHQNKARMAVSDMVALVTRNVRVDKATAPEVGSICKGFLERAVGGVCNESLIMCACILDLHSRCAFWLGRHVVLDIPAHLLGYLEESLSGSKVKCDEGLVFLGCQRLRQLHSAILERQRKEIEDSIQGDKTLLSLHENAEQLACFLGSVADRAGSKLWRLIAENFTYWVQYSTDLHAADFLKWISRTFVGSKDNKETMSEESYQDYQVAKLLLLEETFYENSRVSTTFAVAGLSTALDIITSVFSSLPCSDKKHVQPVDQLLQGPQRSMADDLKLLAKKAIALDKLSPESQSLCRERFMATGTLINHLVEMPLPTSSVPVSAQTADLACKLEFSFRCILYTEGDGQGLLAGTLGTLRSYLCSIFMNSGQRIIWEDSDCRLLGDFLRSTTDLLLLHNEKLRTAEDFLGHNGKLLRFLIGSMVASGLVLPVSKSIRAMFSSEKTFSRLHALLVLSRDIVEGFARSSPSPNSLEGCGDLVEAMQELLQHALAGSDEERKVDGMLLTCDLIRLEVPLDPTVEESILEFSAQTLSTPEVDKTLLESCSYTIGSLAMKDLSKKMKDQILDLILRQSEPNSLLDGAFCRIVQKLSAFELDRVFADLLETDEDGMLSISRSPLHLVLLLFQYIKEEEQIEIMAKSGHDIYSLSLRQLGESVQPEKLSTALLVLDNLVRRRDIFIFREFDLAVSLSQLSTVLGTMEKDSSNMIPLGIFNRCTTVLASMFHRYSKLMYACAPCVISLYHVLQSHAVHATDSPNRSQGYAGVCELLISHKEIYKKHVLGLVLEFVHALGDLSLERRESLIPAIYSLLDVMSTYEMQQLNATMTTHHKILFRTIMQGYRKVHEYKGH